MDAQFTHLSGDIRQPVLIVGDDPDVEGNVLYAPLLPVQSIGKLNLYDSAVASPTDVVDGEGKTDTALAGGTADSENRGVIEGEASVSSPTAEATAAAPSGDTPVYTDNGDGTYTRTTDGVRGHFGPDGFIESGGENVTGVAWGQGQ